MSTWSGRGALWDGETCQLVGRQGKDAEQEMAGYLRVPPDTNMECNPFPLEFGLPSSVPPLDQRR